MSKTTVTVFLCKGKDCTKAWHKVCNESPKKFLKEHLKSSGMPYKLKVVETSCMDACKQAANVCFVCGDCADCAREIKSPDDADRILIHLRSCVESVSLFSDVLNRLEHQ
ncbi:MAG: (2Fe-2S) ferredoxin domain-containing protein [Gemmataceae bacterium]